MVGNGAPAGGSLVLRSSRPVARPLLSPVRESRALRQGGAMGLTIDRVLIANSETERAIRGALEGVGVPPGEDWTATMTALSRSSAWELILQGPTCIKSAYFDWDIVESA